MENFKVGDEVRITDNERVYDKYNTWAEMVKAKNWRLGFAPNNGSIGKITKLAEHTLESKTIALVDIDGMDVIIALDGFELICEKKCKTRTMKNLKDGFDEKKEVLEEK